MQNHDVPDKTSSVEHGQATAPLFRSDRTIRLPRCECCGALIPLNDARDYVDEIASCIVCGHRNL
jgi:hypothetical protein